MPDWSVTKNNGTILDDEWHIHRFGLFENYCLPSVQNQTNKNFKWLIFFDESTPDKFRKRIDKLLEETRAFYPIYIDGGNLLLESILETIQNMTRNEDDILITSRLDNDDLIEKSFVETIQSMADDSTKYLIDARCGFRMNNDKIIHVKKKFGPFLSLIEPIGNHQTIFSTGHGQWKKLSEGILKIVEKPLWMQVIHEKNMKNSFSFFAKKVKNLDLSTFGLQS